MNRRINGSGARLRYREESPRGRLAEFVDCFWYLADEDGEGPRPLERLLPIGSVEVVLHHRSAFRQWPGEGRPRTLARGVVAGQLTGPLYVQPAGPVETMGIRFFPAGASAFFGTRLDELTDRIVGFSDVWGSEGERFEERLLSAGEDSERSRIAEEFLLGRLSAGGRRDERVEFAAIQIRRRRGLASVSNLARSAGLSARQLERRFADALGIGPKALCRVVRFQTLVGRLSRLRRPDWAGLALDCGYSDQAHLVNEVRRLSGLTPRGLLARRRSESTDEPGFTLDGGSGLRVCPASAAPAGPA
jgi:AraC-like DNA-binding protein